MRKKCYTTHLVEVEEGYNKYASMYDKRAEYLSSFEQGKLLKIIGDLNGKKVLDVGAGTGRIPDLLKEKNKFPKTADITAIDISEEMLKILKKKHPSIKVIHSNAECLPFEDESFDIIIAAFFIVHLKDPQKFFDEVYRVLKPNGVLIVTNVNQRKAPKLYTKDNEEIVIQSFYHIPQHIIQKLETAVFKIEEEIFTEEGGTWVNQIIKATK